MELSHKAQDYLKANRISRTETKVIKYLVEEDSCSNKDIANKLFISEKTVKFHFTNVFKKLKVKSRVELVKALSPLVNVPG